MYFENSNFKKKQFTLFNMKNGINEVLGLVIKILIVDYTA